ncbi:unnamed protein product [Nippostrongylus brasiliensis]|uniref:Anoctamin n=1 Tax=Nippostrongylus brasiliensis TaxID=27835 RepID=A0A0N4YVB0_NIPBR|nr:unnamed protein product [Nippostrongylus brasiliensis]
MSSGPMMMEAPACEPHIFNEIQTDARLFGGMPIAIFGIITNIVNIVVFLHQEMRCSLVNHFLLILEEFEVKHVNICKQKQSGVSPIKNPLSLTHPRPIQLEI